MTFKGTSGQAGNIVAGLFDAPSNLHTGNRRHIPVHVGQVQRAKALVQQAGLVEKLVLWRLDDGFNPSKGGRKASITDEQLLTLLMLLALESQPLHVTLLALMVKHRLTDKAAAELGLNPDTGTQNEWYYRLWRAARKVLAPIDPHPETPRRERLSKKVFYRIRDSRDPKFVAARLKRMHEFSNALIWASVGAMPEHLRKRWDGTIAMDATPVLASRIGSPKRSTRVSSEPDAGWYVREHDALGDDGGGDKMKWAWDATLVTMASPCEDDSFPKLLLGMSMDKPGFRPAENAMTAMDNLLSSDLPRGYAVGDRVYFPMTKPEKLQVPLRMAGYKLVGHRSSGRRACRVSTPEPRWWTATGTAPPCPNH